ncbi:MAG: threonylcarbamoyl-AMP synthase [Lachnospiraceae bacterium]|nr:threonylcarbamoyl-AMP synthase [Lachnospiraceae bacterium]
MITRVVKQNENNIDSSVMAEAGRIIKDGGLVAFPTETVYGLGGDALNPESSKKIYAAKGRPSDNPLIVHIYRFEDLRRIVKNVPEKAQKIMDAFWPGPLTIVFEKTDEVPYETTGGLDTVAVRFPIHPTAMAFIEAAGGFVAAPSANLSGRPSPTLAEYVIEDMDSRIEMIIDGGDIPIGLESTIVDVTGEIPMILRPGFVTKEMLEEVVGEVSVDPTILDVNCTARPKAPGMRYRHYAPKADLMIVRGDEDRVADEIRRLLSAAKAEGKRTGVICTDETIGKFDADVVRSAGSRADMSSVGASLYRILREFDDENVEVAFSESFDGDGFCMAIMNRLVKAAGHRILEV